MKLKRVVSIFVAVLLANRSFSDDIEMFVTEMNSNPAPFVGLVVDVTDDAHTFLCRYGEDDACGVLVTGLANVDLSDSHAKGDPVSYLDAAQLALGAALSDPRFARISLSLIAALQGGDLAQMTAYTTLGSKLKGVSGYTRVLESLLELRDHSGVGNLSIFPNYIALEKNLSGQRSGQLPSGHCLSNFPIYLSVAPISTKQVMGYGGALITGFSGELSDVTVQNVLYQKLVRALSKVKVGSQYKFVRRVSPSALVSAIDLQELYVAMFQPDALSRWKGNLKKFTLARSPVSPASSIEGVVDASGENAFETDGEFVGHIAEQAIGLWTRTDLLASDDGWPANRLPMISRGGAGQRVTGYSSSEVIGNNNHDSSARQVYIEPGVSGPNNPPASLSAFDSNGTGPGSMAFKIMGKLGAASVEEADALIRWGRGQDVDDEDGDGDTSDARPWLMGSLIHSKPVAVNYGAIDGYSKRNPKLRVYFGTGDGLFRGIENTRRDGGHWGAEVFALYPDSALANMSSRRANLTPALQMPYGVDGSPSSFVIDHNGDGNINADLPDADQAYVYFGLRRGGNSYYALNVSDTRSPPSLAWKIARGEHPDFPELGLSFSRPLVGKVKFSRQALDVVIFAGGYNGGWNDSYTQKIGKDFSAADDVKGGISHGNALYIVNARTGELVWKAVYGENTSTASTSTNTQFHHAQLVDSIPSSVAALRNPSGVIHRLYVGDTGGAVWRVDLPIADQSDNPRHRKERWFISKFAELGTDGATSDRRFFHPPDIIRAVEDNGIVFDGVLISSGDRAHPNKRGVVNYHFYLKDHLTLTGDSAVRLRQAIRIPARPNDGHSEFDDMFPANPYLYNISTCASPTSGQPVGECALSIDYGWMLEMTRPGEKSFASPLVDGGKVFLSSYVPAPEGVCVMQHGSSYVHLVNLKDGSAFDPSGEVFSMGKGLVSPMQTLGDGLLSPLGSREEALDKNCMGPVCERFAKPMKKIYWRDLGVDDF